MVCVYLCFSLISLIGAIITVNNINFILLFLTNTFKCFMTHNKESYSMTTGFFVVHFRVSRSKYHEHSHVILIHIKSKFPSDVSSLLHRPTLARASFLRVQSLITWHTECHKRCSSAVFHYVRALEGIVGVIDGMIMLYYLIKKRLL